MFGRRLEPSVVSYNESVSASQSSSQWAHALALFREIPGRSLEPGASNYCAGITACEWMFHAEQDAPMIGDCCGWSGQATIAMFGRRLEPNVVSFNASTSASEKGSQWTQALTLLREMFGRRLDPDVVSHSSSVSASGKGSQWAQSFELLRELWCRRLEPNVVS